LIIDGLQSCRIDIANERENMVDLMVDQEQTGCTRCGTCCTKGGPGLHTTDIPLVLGKKIGPQNLYTIRIGELVKDNINGGLIHTDTEIIKIRSVPGSSACLFFRNAEHSCGIYDNRPSQCRALHCRDTREIVDLHAENRMSRQDLFGGITWLWDIIEAHESRCRYREINRLIDQRRSGDEAASRRIAEVISIDQAMRETASRYAAIEEMLDLVFGMPVKAVIEQRYGIRAEKRDTPVDLRFK
jgi:Fe-S-cluster containining protein